MSTCKFPPLVLLQIRELSTKAAAALLSEDADDGRGGTALVTEQSVSTYGDRVPQLGLVVYDLVRHRLQILSCQFHHVRLVVAVQAGV